MTVKWVFFCISILKVMEPLSGSVALSKRVYCLYCLPYWKYMILVTLLHITDGSFNNILSQKSESYQPVMIHLRGIDFAVTHMDIIIKKGKNKQH